MRGWMVVSSLLILVGAAGGILFTNGGFENWSGREPDDWTISGPGLSTEQEGDTVLAGTSSCKLVWTTTTTRWIVQEHPVTGGTDYTYSLWAYDNDPFGRVRGTLRWHRGDGSLISSVNTSYSVDGTDWQELAISELAPSDAETVHVEIRVYDVDWGDTISSASVFVDSTVSLVGGAGGTLLANGGFEVWSGRVPDDWTISGEGLSTEQEGDTVLAGTSSCKLVWTTTTTRWIVQEHPVTGGTDYTYSLWAYDNDPFGRVRGTLRWHRGDGSLISSVNTSYSVDGTDWQELAISELAPSDAETVHVEIRVYDVDWGDTIISASVFVDSTLFALHTETGVEENDLSFFLANIENPVRDRVSILFALKETSNISLSVYNLLGQRIAQLANRRFASGEHRLNWAVQYIPAGIYFIKLVTEREAHVRKIVVLK